MTRSTFTWLAYLMLGFYAYMQASLGPLIPFLRRELSINYTVAGLHSSAFAIGMILAGTSGEKAAKRLGRKQLFWYGGLGMSLGGLALTIGLSPFITVFAALIMGTIGSYLLVMIQALLSDEFGEHRAVALTEANIIASIFAMLAPLTVGFGTFIGVGWRLALCLGALLWLVSYLMQHNLELPRSRNMSFKEAANSSEPLPRIFWLYWLIVFIGVSIEWSMIFWAADFLVTVVNVQSDLASSLLSFLFAAMIIGRFLGSRLTRYVKTVPLLFTMSIVIIIGFPIFWLSSNLALNVLGLFVVGLGLANLFPLALSAASDVGSVDVDKASSRVSQAAGLAILLSPQTLGTLADHWGIFRAYAVIPILLFILIIMIVFAFYLNRSKTP